MTKILRKDKIDYFIDLYKAELKSNADDLDLKHFSVINQIIIDSVGISGLKKVKKEAWEK